MQMPIFMICLALLFDRFPCKSRRQNLSDSLFSSHVFFLLLLISSPPSVLSAPSFPCCFSTRSGRCECLCSLCHACMGLHHQAQPWTVRAEQHPHPCSSPGHCGKQPLEPRERLDQTRYALHRSRFSQVTADFS